MKLVMTLLVRDEEEILEPNLIYHLNQGVDLVIATDNRSEDRTPEILERYARLGCVHVIAEAGEDYSQSRWVTRMARLAATEFDADWVINCDADEFWWPLSGTLEQTLAAIPTRFGYVEAPVTEFEPSREETGFFADRMVVRRSRFRRMRKVAHRADPEVVVRPGNHSIQCDGLAPYPDPHLIEVRHFPNRSYAQFERKVKIAGRAFANNEELPPNIGRGMREAYELYLEGRLREAYDSGVMSDQQVEARLSSGVFVIDRGLQRFFEAWREP